MPRSRSVTTSGRTRLCTSTSASTSPGTGWGPTGALRDRDLGQRPDARLRSEQPRARPPRRRQVQADVHATRCLRVSVQAAPDRPRRGDRVRHARRPGRRSGPDPASERRPDAAHRQRAHPGSRGTSRSPGRRFTTHWTTRPRSTPRSGTAPMGTEAPTPAGSSGGGTSASTRSASRPATATSSRGPEATSPTSRRPICLETSAAPRSFASRSRRRAAGAIHSSTVNADPSTVTRPPWRSTIAETIDSPRPGTRPLRPRPARARSARTCARAARGRARRPRR